jgi:hypothetical protein
MSFEYSKISLNPTILRIDNVSLIDLPWSIPGAWSFSCVSVNVRRDHSGQSRGLFGIRHSWNYFFFHVREQNDVNVCVLKQNFNENEQCWGCDIEWHFLFLHIEASVFAVYLLNISKLLFCYSSFFFLLVVVYEICISRFIIESNIMQGCTVFMEMKSW